MQIANLTSVSDGEQTFGMYVYSSCQLTVIIKSEDDFSYITVSMTPEYEADIEITAGEILGCMPDNLPAHFYPLQKVEAGTPLHDIVKKNWKPIKNT